MQMKIMRPSNAYVAPKKLAMLAALGGSLVLTGCAGNPPTQQMTATNLAITAAETAGAVEYAPTDIQNARLKLSEAQRSEYKKKYDDARALAEQAEWDARVAERRSSASKAQRALDEAQKGIEVLGEKAYSTLD